MSDQSEQTTEALNDPEVTLVLPSSLLYVVMAHLSRGAYQDVWLTISTIQEQAVPQLSRHAQLAAMAAGPAAAERVQ